MSKKSEIKNNNTKSGFCRKGGTWVYDKNGKLLEGPGTTKAKPKETKKLTKDDEGGK